MAIHRDRSEEAALPGDADRGGGRDNECFDRGGNAFPAGGNRPGMPGGIEDRHCPDGAGGTGWRHGGEDDDPVFGGGDEDLLHDIEDADWRSGGAGATWLRGSARHRRSWRGEDEPWLPGDDGEDFRFGGLHAEKCALEFLGDTDCTFHLGDGEDLP